MPLTQDISFELLTCSPACYYCATAAPTHVTINYHYTTAARYVGRNVSVMIKVMYMEIAIYHLYPSFDQSVTSQ